MDRQTNFGSVVDSREKEKVMRLKRGLKAISALSLFFREKKNPTCSSDLFLTFLKC